MSFFLCSGDLTPLPYIIEELLIEVVLEKIKILAQFLGTIIFESQC